MQLKDVSEKTGEILERSLRRRLYNQSPERRLRGFQVSPLWDVSETQYGTFQRCN